MLNLELSLGRTDIFTGSSLLLHGHVLGFDLHSVVPPQNFPPARGEESNQSTVPVATTPHQLQLNRAGTQSARRASTVLSPFHTLITPFNPASSQPHPPGLPGVSSRRAVGRGLFARHPSGSFITHPRSSRLRIFQPSEHRRPLGPAPQEEVRPPHPVQQ